MFLWIRLNSELLRYHGVQNFAKNDTENAELAVAQTAAFSVSTQKPVPSDTWTNFFKRASSRGYSQAACSLESFFLSSHFSPDFIWGSGTRSRGFPEAPKIQGGWWRFLNNWLWNKNSAQRLSDFCKSSWKYFEMECLRYVSKIYCLSVSELYIFDACI